MYDVYEELNECLDEKIVALEHIRRLTLCQSDAIANEEYEVLSRLIEEKQNAMDAIDEYNFNHSQRIAELQKLVKITQLNEINSVSFVSDTREVKKIKQMYSVIEDIKGIEKKNTEELKIRLEDIAINIKKVKTGKKALNKYAIIGAEAGGGFVDIKR